MFSYILLFQEAYFTDSTQEAEVITDYTHCTVNGTSMYISHTGGAVELEPSSTFLR
jgi:hypothetical protein